MQTCVLPFRLIKIGAMTKQNIERLLAIREGKRNVIEKNIESLSNAIEENDTAFFDLAMAKIETAMDLVSSFNETTSQAKAQRPRTMR